MGFEDRDYTQAEAWKDAAPTDNPVTKWLVILTIGLFILQALTFTGSGSSIVYETVSLKAPEVLQGQVWRLFTFPICIHPYSIIGLVLSLLFTWRFGTELERMYGSREMLFYYPVMGLFVGLGFTAWQFVVPLPLPLDGVYAVALGVLALFATHFPRMEVCIFPMIVIQIRWLVALAALFALYPALQAIQAGQGVGALAYASEVLSIVFALAYRRFDWHLSTVAGNVNPAAWIRSVRLRASRRHLRVFQPMNDGINLDTKVDAILAKIHEHGTESLTEAEQAILAKASERYKNRT